MLSWATNDEIAWCSTWLNAMAENAGLERSGKANARSWLKVGREIAEPKVGDIVIYWRRSPKDWRGHVGIFIREKGDYIYTLGGNQSNRVNIAPYHKSRLLGYRRLGLE